MNRCFIQGISLHNTIFRKNVRLVKERAHMSASIGWQQSKDDVADRSMAVPCHADFVSTEGGDFSFFFYVYFSVPPRHFSRPSCRYSALKRVSSKRPPFLCRGFPFKRHSDIASSSSWSAQISLEWKDTREKKVCSTDYDFHTICEQTLKQFVLLYSVRRNWQIFELCQFF